MKDVKLIIVIWLFIATFMLYNTAIQKINIEKEKLNLEEWKLGKKEPLKFLGEKPYISEKSYQIIKLDNPYMPLARFNQQTGDTECWNTAAGGWVLITGTTLMTAVSSEEKQKRNEIIDGWYNGMSANFKSKVSKESFEAIYNGTPSSQLEDYVKNYEKDWNKWEDDFLKLCQNKNE